MTERGGPKKDSDKLSERQISFLLLRQLVKQRQSGNQAAQSQFTKIQIFPSYLAVESFGFILCEISAARDYNGGKLNFVCGALENC